MTTKRKPAPKRATGKTAITRRDIRAAVPPSVLDEVANQNQVEAQARQARATRRAQVGAMYHAGQTQMEIADTLGIAQATVSDDLKYLRQKWQEQAIETIGAWSERELAYAVEQRAAVRNQWIQSYNPRFQQIMVRWTERIAKLLGLDAPEKVEDWTDRDWREFARANGIDEAEVIAEAERIVTAGNASRRDAVAADGRATGGAETVAALAGDVPQPGDEPGVRAAP